MFVGVTVFVAVCDADTVILGVGVWVAEILGVCVGVFVGHGVPLIFSHPGHPPVRFSIS